MLIRSLPPVVDNPPQSRPAHLRGARRGRVSSPASRPLRSHPHCPISPQREGTALAFPCDELASSAALLLCCLSSLQYSAPSLRLALQHTEWLKVQRTWNESWRDVVEKNYLKSLDNKLAPFKRNDINSLKPKAIRQTFKDKRDTARQTRQRQQDGQTVVDKDLVAAELLDFRFVRVGFKAACRLSFTKLLACVQKEDLLPHVNSVIKAACQRTSGVSSTEKAKIEVRGQASGAVVGNWCLQKLLVRVS